MIISNKLHNGSASLEKKILQYKFKDYFNAGIPQITIETTNKPKNLATTYLPVRRPYLPIPGFHCIVS